MAIEKRTYMKSLFELKTTIHPDIKGESTYIKSDVIHFLERSLDIIYPGNVRKVFKSEVELSEYQKETCNLLKEILTLLAVKKSEIDLIAKHFSDSICEIAHLVYGDATSLISGDPSANSITEVILTYPGLEAVAAHRIAHVFYKHNVPILPRALSEIIHGRTGIDIHPGAQIGKSFYIDHGTGVVIGETAVIGKNVKIYQGVTMGALSVDKTLAQKKRHPTIEDNCIIYSHATILGGETVIGANSIIGGNVWITKSIPSDSVVYHKSEVKLNRANKMANNFEEELSYEI